MKPNKDRQLRVCVTKKTLKAVEDKAERLELNKSDIVRDAIKAYLKNGHESN